MYKSIFKRLIDVLIALSVLLVFLPIYVIITIILAVLNDGKPFFTQKRVGKGEKIFKLIKFKTMNDKKDPDGMLLKDIERLTPFGNFLRKSSLDELPQVLNVLKGDMSLVGPRPLLPEYLPYYSEYHKRRHEVQPGVTGLAQVNGRSDLKFSERFNYDVQYVDHVSFVQDFIILLRTFLKFFRSNDVKLGRPMSSIDDIGLTRGLSKNYFHDEKPKDQ